MATLLLYQWNGSSRPDLIWEQLRRRFLYPGSLTRTADLHLSPNPCLLLSQGPLRELQITDVSAAQIRSPQPLLFADCLEHGLHMPSVLSEVSLVGWSYCGQLVAVICSCPAHDSISAAGRPYLAHSFLHIWHAASASLLLKLDLAHVIFGTANMRFYLHNLAACWAPRDHGKGFKGDSQEPRQQVRSLAIVHAGACWNHLEDSVMPGLLAGCILRVLAPDRPAEAADGPVEAAAVWQRIPMQLGSMHEGALYDSALNYPPTLQWSPEGSHVSVKLGTLSCLLDQHGHEVPSATIPGSQPPTSECSPHGRDGDKAWRCAADQPDLCWASPCSKVLVRLFLVAGVGLRHCDAYGEHQVEVKLPVPDGLRPVLDESVSFAWQPASSS